MSKLCATLSLKRYTRKQTGVIFEKRLLAILISEQLCLQRFSTQLAYQPRLAHWLEQRLQILCSEWLKRLWTLQEGRLTSKLYIQFKHSAVSVQSLMRAMEDSHTLGQHNIRTIIEVEIHFSRPPQGNTIEYFQNLPPGLGHRSTAFKADEPIVLATLLGLPFKKLDHLPTMSWIYRTYPKLPKDLLFVISQHLPALGFRLAPQSFLEQGRPISFQIDENSGILVQEGFIVRKAVYFLMLLITTMKTSFKIIFRVSS